MKKLYKKFITFMAMVMLVTACSFSTACADIKTLEIKVSVYDYENSQTLTGDDYVLTVDLYRHLAPKTVDAIIDLVENGYYNDTFFYQQTDLSYDTANSLKKILVGNFKYVNGEIIEQIAPHVEAEFESAGVVGSNLLNNKGSIGLYRSAYVSDTSYKTNSSAQDSGRGTMFLPLQEIKDYNGYYTVFGSFDVEAENNKKVFDALYALFDSSNENFDEYKVYYTGDYDMSKPNENYGLKFNYVLNSEYANIKDGIAKLFEESEGMYLDIYSPHKIYVPKVKDGNISARIVSASVK